MKRSGQTAMDADQRGNTAKAELDPQDFLPRGTSSEGCIQIIEDSK